jgi:predicted HTH transcriptional regulator
MINKRLLIKNLLAHNDENSFYDKKRSISIGEKEGKAKFLKHVCALANTNPLKQLLHCCWGRGFRQ